MERNQPIGVVDELARCPDEEARARTSGIAAPAAPLSEAAEAAVLPSQSRLRQQNRMLALTLASVAAFILVTAITLVFVLHYVDFHQVVSRP